MSQHIFPLYTLEKSIWIDSTICRKWHIPLNAIPWPSFSCRRRSRVGISFEVTCAVSYWGRWSTNQSPTWRTSRWQARRAGYVTPTRPPVSHKWLYIIYLIAAPGRMRLQSSSKLVSISSVMLLSGVDPFVFRIEVSANSSLLQSVF